MSRGFAKLKRPTRLVVAALGHVQTHSINATDVVGLHAALGIAQFLRNRGDDLVLVALDQRFLRTAHSERLKSFDPENQNQAALAALIGP